MNTMQKQLDLAVREGKVKPRYTKGYKQWKKDFQEAMRATKGDVKASLDRIHGAPKQKPNK